MPAAPNLFVIGAPKAATTSLHAYLAQHPDVFMSRVKEPKYYLFDGRAPHHAGPGDAAVETSYVVSRSSYEQLFAGVTTQRYVGEATPFYLWSEVAMRRIAFERPDARLIAVLRDPITRAHSNWARLIGSGRETLPDLTAALAAEPARRSRNWEPFWFYRSLGLYGEQLERVYSLFPRDQVKVVFFEDMQARSQEVLDDLLRWLELPTEPVAVRTRSNVTSYAAATAKGRMGYGDRCLLRGRRVLQSVPRLPPRLRRAGERRIDKVLLRERAGDVEVEASVRSVLGPEFEADIALLSKLGHRPPESWRVAAVESGR